MVYKITINDFRNIVDVSDARRGCHGHEIRNGIAEQGHDSCNSCPGNYYAGGECNYGGRHKLTDDLDQINKNFEGFEVLVSRHAKLKGVKDETAFNQEKQNLIQAFETMQQRCENANAFMYGSCIGIEQKKARFQASVQTRFQRFARELGKFIEAVKKVDYRVFAEFKMKLAKIEEMKKEAAQLAEQIKKEKDPTKKTQLIVLLNKVKDDIKGNIEGLKNHPARDLFDDDFEKNLSNALQSIIRGTGTGSIFGKGKGGNGHGRKTENDKRKNNSDDPEKNNQQNETRMFSPTTLKKLKDFSLIFAALLGLWTIYLIAKNKLKGE